VIPSRVSHTPDILTLHRPDGRATRFHAIWLRDNARGPAHRHPGNDQRLFDLTDLPETIAITGASIIGDAVRVRFSPEEIAVDFEFAFLAEHAYDGRASDASTVWGAEKAAAPTRHVHAAVVADPAARKAWIDDVIRDGLALLTGVPTVDGEVQRVAELFGFVRETNYGRQFEVRSEANPTNMAFTPVGLNVHADNPYRDPVPGLQLLHCLVNEAEGGASVFVDGFRAAALLRAEDPAGFDLLTRHWAPFRFADATADLRSRTPYIRLDDRGHVVAVRYNNRSAAPLDLPFEVMADYYAALRRFAALLHRPDGEARLRLEPGDLVLFDNERVFHGRAGFSGGARHLQGCYADKDALRSASLVLARRMDLSTQDRRIAG
jgi:gamma-butyrobetaine hydroxylase